MPRLYILNMADSTLTSGTGTILFANPGAARTYELVRMILGQRSTTTAAMLTAQLFRQVSTFPTLVTTNLTMAKVDENDAACALSLATTGAAGTAGCNASAEGAGAKTAVEEFPFLNTAGLDLWFPEGQRIIAAGGSSSGLGLRMMSAPANLANWSASFWLLER